MKQIKYLEKILDKEINQIKQLKTAGYLDTKDQDKIKQVMCLYLQKMRQKTIFLQMLGIFEEHKLIQQTLKMKLNFNYKKKAENIKRQKYSMRIKFIERKSSSVKSIVVK